VLTSHRTGALQLRWESGSADSNVLSPPELVTTAHVPQWEDLFGIALSWVLLSLGAPFWFDVLKNSLKLRPSAATEEETNRTQRARKNA
jgi:hypothetical protein